MWEGRVCLVTDLLSAYKKVSEEPLFCDLPPLQDMFQIIQIIPDIVDETKDSPEYQIEDYHAIPKGERQRILAAWLVEHFGGANIYVLLLGPSSGTTYTYMMGLLFKKEEKELWCRLGTCQWETALLEISDVVSQQQQFLTGVDERWREDKGDFRYTNLTMQLRKLYPPHPAVMCYATVASVQ